MSKKPKINIFFKILLVLFFVYLAITIACESGYYATKNHKDALLTKEAMQKFEADLANGEVVDIKDYLVDEKVDYSNMVTKIGNKVSTTLSDFMTKGLTSMFNMLKGLFW